MQKFWRFDIWELNRPEKFRANKFCEFGLLWPWPACPTLSLRPAADAEPYPFSLLAQPYPRLSRRLHRNAAALVLAIPAPPHSLHSTAGIQIHRLHL